jgi:hypothetical protein
VPRSLQVDPRTPPTRMTNLRTPQGSGHRNLPLRTPPPPPWPAPPQSPGPGRFGQEANTSSCYRTPQAEPLPDPAQDACGPWCPNHDHLSRHHQALVPPATPSLPIRWRTAVAAESVEVDPSASIRQKTTMGTESLPNRCPWVATDGARMGADGAQPRLSVLRFLNLAFR